MKRGPQTAHKAATRNVHGDMNSTLKQPHLCSLAAAWFTLTVRSLSAQGTLTVGYGLGRTFLACI